MSRAPKAFILTLDIPNDGGYASPVLLHLSSYRSANDHLVFWHANTFERYQLFVFLIVFADGWTFPNDHRTQAKDIPGVAATLCSKP